MKDLGKLENWTKNDLARVVCQALFNSDKPLAAAHFRVVRMAKVNNKPELIRRTEQAIEIISKRNIKSLRAEG